MRQATYASSESNVRLFLEIAKTESDPAEAKLPPEKRRPAGASNADWLRQLAEKAQAKLDAGKAAEA